MRWFPWWNRAIKRQRTDHCSSPHLCSALLATHSSWHHSDGDHTHTHGVWMDCWTEIIQGKAGWGLMLKSAWYWIPPSDDLEVEKVMSLSSVQQQLFVPSMDKSGLWAPRDWNKSARNYFLDKGRCKGNGRSTNVNLQYPYKSILPFCVKGRRPFCEWVDHYEQHLGYLYDCWP